MKINKTLFATTFLILNLIQSSFAYPNQNEPRNLDELRTEYAISKQAYDDIKKPELGEKGFQQNLRVWSEANRRLKEASHTLARPLIKEASKAKTTAEFKVISADVRQIHRDLVGSVDEAKTFAHHHGLQFFAEQILPEVIDKKLAKDRAEFFAELTEPDKLIRHADKSALRGIKTEPIGWVIQAAHSLALARAEKFDLARKESDLLLKKVSILIPSRFKSNYLGGVRTKESLYREFLIHRALIEDLSGDNKAAAKYLHDAKAIKETNIDIQASQKLIEGAFQKKD